jgi:hypothetical protein
MQGTKASKARFSHLVSLSACDSFVLRTLQWTLSFFYVSSNTYLQQHFSILPFHPLCFGTLTTSHNYPILRCSEPKKDNLPEHNEKRWEETAKTCAWILQDFDIGPQWSSRSHKMPVVFFSPLGRQKVPSQHCLQSCRAGPKVLCGFGHTRHHAAPCLKRNQTAPRVLRHMAQSCHPPHLKYLAVTRKMPIYDKLQRATKCSSELHSAFSASLEALWVKRTKLARLSIPSIECIAY